MSSLQMRGKRQRNDDNSGGSEISRRRVNSWQEERQQQPAAAYEALPNQKRIATSMDVLPVGSTIDDLYTENPETEFTFLEATLYVIVFVTVGIGVCVLFPSEEFAAAEEGAIAEQQESDRLGHAFASSLYVIGAIWFWLYLSFLGIMCLKKCL